MKRHQLQQQEKIIIAIDSSLRKWIPQNNYKRDIIMRMVTYISENSEELFELLEQYNSIIIRPEFSLLQDHCKMLIEAFDKKVLKSAPFSILGRLVVLMYFSFYLQLEHPKLKYLLQSQIMVMVSMILTLYI